MNLPPMTPGQFLPYKTLKQILAGNRLECIPLLLTPQSFRL
jgi:hypothetical protein